MGTRTRCLLGTSTFPCRYHSTTNSHSNFIGPPSPQYNLSTWLLYWIIKQKYLSLYYNQITALISKIYFVMKLYTFRRFRPSIIRSLFTVHSAMVYVIQVCRQLSETCRVSWQNEFLKLVHIVGFITKKFVTMHGHMNVKNRNIILNYYMSSLVHYLYLV